MSIGLSRRVKAPAVRLFSRNCGRHGVQGPLAMACLLAWTLVVAPAWGQDNDDFAATLEVDGSELQLNGSALCEWGIFGVDLYYGALYVEKKSRSAKQILESEGAKRIELRFVRKLTREQMVKAYTESAKATAGRALEKYQKSLREFTRHLTAVKDGTVLAVNWIPSRGLQLIIDGKPKCFIEDPAFARFYFTLYLGSKPPTAALKKGLLGG